MIFMALMLTLTTLLFGAVVGLIGFWAECVRSKIGDGAHIGVRTRN